jgi:hypothetical protein
VPAVLLEWLRGMFAVVNCFFLATVTSHKRI